ncbi:MAG TPA: hypothetical protein DCE41_20220 [Cytophagales bacterium]|nr:hypothetical protein [Cytophagales bacterium]HAA21796.1 hypothetical protein [Cytophagales bacterium]HAP59286.1 hypothetical protein [Cytophagales bacterium]
MMSNTLPSIHAQEIRAEEAFLRRAAQVEGPYMLKGSFVTRQYFEQPALRWPRDLDWVCLEMFEKAEKARLEFDRWVIAITEMEGIADGVKFRSFRENQFWRSMDYAMFDDFPTVSTDILCWIEDEEVEFELDISFNLDVPYPTIPLIFSPIWGSGFTIPRTVPLSLQVSWKIHQTLVRARFKDLFDLMHLVKHPAFTEAAKEEMMMALVKECNMEMLPAKKAEKFFTFDFEGLVKDADTLQDSWSYWIHPTSRHSDYKNWIIDFDKAKHMTDASRLPTQFSDFKADFERALRSAGIDEALFLPFKRFFKR